ncbi:ester cyclase [Priestia abyssalis]|uniref:ester cyclase n=1 Tax=Priestia abyssalis TaxID=1221450 RepID=UPI000994C006|nr:ester cyclase [Priestia abyssalis]
MVTVDTELKKEEPKNKSQQNKPKQRKVYYGNSDEVHMVGFSDYNEFHQPKKRKQSMNGFDNDYVDFVDYIMKITHRIWEEKGIGVIYQTYHNDVTMHCGSVNLQGINSVVSNTLQTLHAFPDRRLIGENVIWSGDDKEGFLSSHRILSTATNLGDSSFGPATSKKVSFRTVVDCFCHSNRVVEEWLVRDNLHIVKQLGFDPIELAKKMAASQVKQDETFQTSFGLSETMNGQLVPQVYVSNSANFDVGEFVLELCNKIYEWRLFNHVKDFYADHAVVHYICDKDLVGYQQIQGMFISLFASFPNARFIVDRVTCNKRFSEQEWDVAVRWRLAGLHEGIGYFGSPSGKPVEILGINHLRIRGEKVVEEWVTFDGLDVLKQIYAGTDSGNNSSEE